jgi:integrase
MERGMPTNVESLTREHVEEWLAETLRTRKANTAAPHPRGAPAAGPARRAARQAHQGVRGQGVRGPSGHGPDPHAARHRPAPQRAGRPDLWLGRRGPSRPDGIYDAVPKRAERAGLADVHPHLFRHTFAHAWLAQGGQEQDLMMLAGWRSRTMLGRYGASAAAERAQKAYCRLSPGDRL